MRSYSLLPTAASVIVHQCQTEFIQNANTGLCFEFKFGLGRETLHNIPVITETDLECTCSGLRTAANAKLISKMQVTCLLSMLLPWVFESSSRKKSALHPCFHDAFLWSSVGRLFGIAPTSIIPLNTRASCPAWNRHEKVRSASASYQWVILWSK